MEKQTLEQIDFELKSLELKEKQLTFERNIELRYVMLPESWTMSLVKEIQLNLLNHDKKNAKKIQPGIQGQGGFRSCKKSKNACRIEPAF